MKFVLILMFCLLLSGCFSSSVRYFSLLDGQAVPVMAQDLPSVSRVGVSLVGLPKLINRPQLVVRVSNSEVKFEEQYQWGGRLQEEITQLLSTELQRLHPQQAVYVYPSDNRPVPSQQWTAEVIQLDGVVGGEVSLQASCRLMDKNSRQPLFERTIQRQLTTEGTQMSDYVDVQRTLLKQLAQTCSW